ncbi:MAG: lipid-A-disaccharide synthase [Paludibacteraceae bacterium]|nr:lipid-A-disaccharide synthase [Paludibacteraceae bacterium]
MKYFIIAGEASGDLHASNLMRELKVKDAKAEFCFLGGDLMAAQGGTLVKHYRDMAFMGIISVVLNLRTVLKNLKDCKHSIQAFQPDVVILVDYPSFNLRIAKFVKTKLKNIPVYYYISPKIWAWKEYRIKSIKKYIDKMYTILPFETPFYKKHNFEVTYVGNPCVDSVALRPNQDESFTAFTQRTGLSDKPIVALLAGSRKQEIKGCLPTMLKMAKHYPQYQFIVAGAPGIDSSFYEELMTGTTVKIIYNETYNLLQQAHSAVVNSGTATLETALFRVPQVVVYNIAGGILANIAQSLILKVKYVSLVNLIADKELVKELIAHYFTEKNLRYQLERVLFLQAQRNKMIEGYYEIIALLGEPGTAKHAAEEIYKSLI